MDLPEGKPMISEQHQQNEDAQQEQRKYLQSRIPTENHNMPTGGLQYRLWQNPTRDVPSRSCVGPVIWPPY